MATPEETIESVEVEKDRNVSGRQLAMVAGGLVVLLAALWFLFLRGDSEPEPANQPQAPNAAPSQDEQDKPKAKKSDKGKKAPKTTGSGPVENFEVFAPKDPFEPLVTSSTGGGATDDTSGQTGDTGGNGGNGGGGENVGGHTVRLVDIFTGDGGEQQAQVQVDGTVYRVSEGEVFADSFQLVSIEGDCATMLFGDDQFSLCEGEELLK
jgi:hypothetical protein